MAKFLEGKKNTLTRAEGNQSCQTQLQRLKTLTRVRSQSDTALNKYYSRAKLIRLKNKK